MHLSAHLTLSRFKFYSPYCLNKHLRRDLVNQIHDSSVHMSAQYRQRWDVCVYEFVCLHHVLALWGWGLGRDHHHWTDVLWQSWSTQEVRWILQRVADKKKGGGGVQECCCVWGLYNTFPLGLKDGKHSLTSGSCGICISLLKYCRLLER